MKNALILILLAILIGILHHQDESRYARNYGYLCNPVYGKPFRENLMTGYATGEFNCRDLSI